MLNDPTGAASTFRTHYPFDVLVPKKRFPTTRLDGPPLRVQAALERPEHLPRFARDTGLPTSTLDYSLVVLDLRSADAKSKGAGLPQTTKAYEPDPPVRGVRTSGGRASRPPQGGAHAAGG